MLDEVSVKDAPFLARGDGIVEDDGPAAELDADEIAGMRQGLAEHAAGLSIPIAHLRAKLRKHK